MATSDDEALSWPGDFLPSSDWQSAQTEGSGSQLGGTHMVGQASVGAAAHVVAPVFPPVPMQITFAQGTAARRRNIYDDSALDAQRLRKQPRLG